MGYKIVKKNFLKLLPYKIISYILAITSISFSLILIFKMQTMIDDLQIGGIKKETYFYILIYGMLYLIFTTAYQFIFRRTQIVGRNEITSILYSKLQEKSLNFFQSKNTGEIISLINNEGREVGDWVSFGSLGLIIMFTVFLMNISAMIYLNLHLSFATCLLIFFVFVSTKFLTAKISKLSSESFKTTSKINQLLLQTLNSETLIHTLDKANWFKKRFNLIVFNERYPIDKKRANIHSIYMTIYLFLSTLLPIIVVVVGSFLTEKQDLTIGTLLAFYALTTRLQEPIQIIPEFLNQRKSAIALSEHLLPIIEDDNDVCIRRFEFDEVINKLTVNIDFFTYERNDKRLLENISFSMEPRNILLIKGNSGVGKSTLANIIMGIIKTDNASILQNNEDCLKFTNKSRWKNMLYVEQDITLIEGSILENILLGDEFPNDLINDILITTCLETFMDEKGNKVIINSDGSGVSGGQRQRIGLARIMIRQPNILILDEPTSALDSTTSIEVSKRIVEFTKKRNMFLIVISHKNEFDQYATNILNIN